MEEEIDLREYISILLKYKYWIAGLAVVAAAVAMGVSFLLPPAYQATALVAITTPRYSMEFDSRVKTVDDVPPPPYKAYPTLATGDGIIAALIASLGSELDVEERTVAAVRDMMEAEAASDPSIVKLTIKNGDPARSASIVNRWADLFVESANDLYGQSEQEAAFFEDQLAGAETELTATEQAMIDFQARSEASILAAQLNSKQASLNEYLTGARSLRLIIQDAKSLQDRLRSQDAAASTSLSDELTSLFLEIDALNRGQLPIQLQISGQQGIGNKTVGEQVTFLDSLVRALENKRVVLAQEAESLEPDILALQEKLQQARTEEERLAMARQVAKETYVTLARTLAEARIAAQNTTGDVRLAGYATVPDKPVAPRKMLNTAVAGALGLFVGVFGAFAIEYWRQGPPESKSDN